MKPLTLTAGLVLSACVLGAWTPFAGASLTEPTRRAARADTFESVFAEYEAAVAKHAQQRKEADREERRALRKNKPINAFWGRFAELGKANDGKALLWMAQNMRKYRVIKPSERKQALQPIFGALIESHSGAEWFEDVYGQLVRHKKDLGLEATRGYLDSAIAKVESADMKAAGLFTGYKMLLKDDPEASSAYAKQLAEVATGGYWATRYRAIQGPASVTVGELAPDFTGRTIDGKDIALSDYRGKVVLIDFFGFW